jgi:NAD(P)-dependent dehydrogenase (short-subunit alcohol dehydrogenase family)
MDPESTAYTLSKKSLADYTMMAAIEFAPSVRVNGVAPGAILPAKGRGVKKVKDLSKDNPLKTKSTPADVAETALYLAESPSITGQIIYVDGGKHLEG